MNWLKSMLSDDTGSISTMRVIVFLAALSALLPHLVLSLKTGVVPEFNQSDLYILGIALGGKIAQNAQESPAKPSFSPAP